MWGKSPDATKEAMSEVTPDEGPSPSEIRSALDGILASPGFEKSDQLKSFLRFVVEQTIAGRGDQIKAYTIAVDALGRDPSFDPQLDPIVRVEAGRLRRALENYYTGEGRYDSIVIELPIGHYLPVFREISARQRVATRMRDQWRQLALTVRENYRLILLIVLIAAAVSLTIEALERTIWPELQNVLGEAPPALPAPDSTGDLRR